MFVHIYIKGVTKKESHSMYMVQFFILDKDLKLIFKHQLYFSFYVFINYGYVENISLSVVVEERQKLC